MPPPKDGCKFDDAAWRERLKNELWRSEQSFSKRLTILEEQSKSQRRFLTLWLPIIFSVGTSGLVFILQLLADRFLHDT